MDSFIGVAGVGGAIIASIGLAMWLEWFCLRWLMRVMPGRLGVAQPSMAEAESREEFESLATTKAQVEPELPLAPPPAPLRHEIRPGL